MCEAVFDKCKFSEISCFELLFIIFNFKDKCLNSHGVILLMVVDPLCGDIKKDWEISSDTVSIIKAEFKQMIFLGRVMPIIRLRFDCVMFWLLTKSSVVWAKPYISSTFKNQHMNIDLQVYII